jgi:hypothetical protein
MEDNNQPWNPQGRPSALVGDEGVADVISMNQLRSRKRPMPSGKASFTGNPVDRQMNENFATQPGSAYAGSTSGSSTYQVQQ